MKALKYIIDIFISLFLFCVGYKFLTSLRNKKVDVIDQEIEKINKKDVSSLVADIEQSANSKNNHRYF